MPMDNYGYGGPGNDKIYGTDGNDEIFGEVEENDPDAMEADDIEGGDDWLAGYGGEDIIHGGYGND